MSSLTSTPAALASELRGYDGRGWRFVEAQHLVSTLKLVDSLAEQALLEDLIEATKPPLPAECRHLDYLLTTPFRYDAEYPRGSRFRRAGRTPGAFYASEQPQTAIAEIAFYRLLFFAESPATPWPKNAAEYTGFAALISTKRALDLTAPPLDADRNAWTDPQNYQPCQDLADWAREAGANVLRYESVRDPQRRANLAVLSCTAFAAPAPVERQTWRIRLSANGVQALCEFPRESVEYSTAAFANDPRMSLMNWER
jgi:hypothetical protein